MKAATSARQVKNFLGPKILLLLFFGLGLSISLFFVECGLPYFINLLLFRLGYTQIATTVPSWLPSFVTEHILFSLVIIIAIRGTLNWLLLVDRSLVNELFRLRLRRRLISKVYTAETYNTGKALSLFGEGINHGAYFLSNFLQFSTSLVLSVLLAATLFYYEVTLTTWLFLGIGCLGGLIAYGNWTIKHYGQTVVDAWTRVNLRISASLKNLILVRIYGMQKFEMRVTNAQLRIISSSLIRHSAISGGLSYFSQIFGVSLLFGLISIHTQNQSYPPGFLIGYIYLSLRFFIYSTESVNAFGQTQIWFSGIKELFKWWNHSAAPTIALPVRTAFQDKTTMTEPVGWRVSHLSFSYHEGKTTALKNLSFNIPAGSVFFISGHSGSGKSTLLNLLMGVTLVQTGKIEVRCSGVYESIKDAHTRLLKVLGYVGPESFLIEGTILENICYGLKKKPTSSELIQSIEMANCSFIYDLPHSLKHEITEQGTGLSMGQKQRLSLLRALLRKPKVIILDEPTSNVDYDTEKQIIESLLQLKGHATLIVVSHRGDFANISDQHLDLDTLNIKSRMNMIA